MRTRSLLLVLLTLSLPAIGNDKAPAPARPTIAIALEGGGALGFAHIGVLQWMEEHHIPVDYVAGTSMGGLVGGAYATGMKPQEIRELIKGIDWVTVLRGGSEYSDLSFRRKEDKREYPNSLEFGLRRGAKFPAGFNSGQQVDFVLDKIALPYSNIKSFDDLPIPFRCVAVDLVARREHVFTAGSLAQALRSTMSIPGFFTPVREKGKIYVDGGLLNNLPTDVAKQMGADVVIGVHLDETPLSPDASLSSFGTLAQAFSVVTRVNEQRGIDLADVLVRVDLTKFGGGDYSRADPLIEQGYRAAQNSAPALLKFALNEREWQAFLDRRNARRIKTVPVPSFVEVVGTTQNQAEAIQKDFEEAPGHPVNEAQLEQKLNLLTGSGRFATMGYSIAEEDGRFGLRIRATEKEYAPPTVNPIFLIDGSQYNNVLFSAGARFTFLDVGKPGAELRTDVLAGSSYQLSPEYFRPVSSTKWFIAPAANVSSVALNLYQHNTQLAGYRLSQMNGAFDVGYMFDRFSELRAGYNLGWQDYEPVVGNPNLLPAISGRQSLSRVRYVSDRLDSPIVPRKGVVVATEFDFFDARPAAVDKFPALQLSAQYFKPLGRPDSVYFTVSGGTTFTFSKTGVPPFSLGGPLRLSAYGQNEILTNQFVLFQGGYLRQIGELPPIIGHRVYFTALYELAKPYKTPLAALNGFSSAPMDGGAGFVVETLFGPAYIGGSWGDSGHRKIFFKLGRIF